MLLTILGWFWIITGVIFLLNPQMCRNKLKKKSIKTVKQIFFGFALVLGILLIKATWGVPGILPRILMILGLIGIGKAFFFLKAQSADKLITWFLDQPLKFFRMWAVGQIVFGAFILSA